MTHVRFTPEDIAKKFYEAQIELEESGKHPMYTRHIDRISWEGMLPDWREFNVDLVRSLIDQGVIVPGEAHELPSKKL